MKDFYLKLGKSEPKVGFCVDDELELAKSKILQLKSEKKRLQEALRTVIVERNRKSEKLKMVRERYGQVTRYLKKQHDFIQGIRKEYEELRKNREGVRGQSIVKKEIFEYFKKVKSYVGTGEFGLMLDKGMIESLSTSVKSERWDEFVLKVLKRSVKVAKEKEFVDQDTPQFSKQTTDSKIDAFLENSKGLLESLAFQQEKLKKIGEDCFKPKGLMGKHAKTMSYAPGSPKVLTPTISKRDLRSSLDENMGILETTKSKKSFSKEILNTKKKNRLIHDTN